MIKFNEILAKNKNKDKYEIVQKLEACRLEESCTRSYSRLVCCPSGSKV